MDRSLTLESVRLTEAAALFAARHMGRGNAVSVFRSASNAMMDVFKKLPIRGRVISGTEEGTILCDGSLVGQGLEFHDEVELAVKPVDGKETCARGSNNSAAYLSFGGPGSFRRVPHVPMYKIAAGGIGKDIIDINQSPEINIRRIARAKGKYIDDITVCVLEKEWNDAIVREIQEAGARIEFIRDGDISGAIASAMDDNVIDLLMGIGWAQDALIAAAALKCLGGDLQGRFMPETETDRKEIAEHGINENDIFRIVDLVPGNDILVSGTGITDGVLLKGVRYITGGAKTDSIVMRMRTHTVRSVDTIHRFDYKPIY